MLSGSPPKALAILRVAFAVELPMDTNTRRPDDRAELLACAFDSLSVPIVTKNLDGMITSWNGAAARVFGYGTDEAVGRHISMLVPPERGVEETRILETIRRGEAMAEFETVRLRKDGSRVEVAVTISPLRNRQGEVVGAAKVARELTLIRQAEKNEQDHREQMAITLSSIADAIVVTDERGQITYLNPSAENLTGWRLDYAKGQALESVFRIINEVTRRRAENPISRVLQEGVVAGLANHTALVAKDGTERAIDDSAAPIRRPDGTISGAVLVFRDVSQQRSAEEMRARLAAIVESSEDAIISKDLEGRITSWNVGAHRLFGYTADEMVGRHVSLLIPPINLKEETEILSRIRSGERIEHFETIRLAKGGRTVHVSLTVSPIKNSEGMVIGASKIARDVTEQRQIRDALRDAKDHLEKTVADRTARLQEAITDLEHFSYSMSHDLRAPLRNIASFASLLLGEQDSSLNEEARKYVRRIAASAERMDRLMNDALEYLRVAQGEMSLAPVDVERTLEEVVEHSPHLQPEKAHIEIARPLMSVLASEALLPRCISNLLGNAVKFMEPGCRPSVKVWTEARGDQVRFCVRDNGIGIPNSDLTRIWRIFERGHEYKRYEGTGVGLSLVKRAVERMGGCVGVESEPGEGSLFWFNLRATPRPASSTP